MAYLHHLSQDSVVVPAIWILLCNWNIICYAEHIWLVWNILLIFLWNMLPAGATPMGSLVSLYQSNWHANLVEYEDNCQNDGCGNFNWHQLWSCSMHLLVLVLYHFKMAHLYWPYEYLGAGSKHSCIGFILLCHYSKAFAPFSCFITS